MDYGGRRRRAAGQRGPAAARRYSRAAADRAGRQTARRLHDAREFAPALCRARAPPRPGAVSHRPSRGHERRDPQARCASLAAAGYVTRRRLARPGDDALARLHADRLQTDSDVAASADVGLAGRPAVAVTYANAIRDECRRQPVRLQLRHDERCDGRGRRDAGAFRRCRQCSGSA